MLNRCAGKSWRAQTAKAQTASRGKKNAHWFPPFPSLPVRGGGGGSNARQQGSGISSHAPGEAVRHSHGQPRPSSAGYWLTKKIKNCGADWRRAVRLLRRLKGSEDGGNIFAYTSAISCCARAGGRSGAPL